ncbi:hypothetical protein X777_13817, partial [Ooceraea biroi]
AQLCYPYLEAERARPSKRGIPEPAPSLPFDVAVPLFSPYRYVALLLYVRSGDHLRWRVFDLLNHKNRPTRRPDYVISDNGLIAPVASF